jgi:hypothetical protein
MNQPQILTQKIVTNWDLSKLKDPGFASQPYFYFKNDVCGV